MTPLTKFSLLALFASPLVLAQFDPSGTDSNDPASSSQRPEEASSTEVESPDGRTGALAGTDSTGFPPPPTSHSTPLAPADVEMDQQQRRVELPRWNPYSMAPGAIPGPGSGPLSREARGLAVDKDMGGSLGPYRTGAARRFDPPARQRFGAWYPPSVPGDGPLPPPPGMYEPPLPAEIPAPVVESSTGGDVSVFDPGLNASRPPVTGRPGPADRAGWRQPVPGSPDYLDDLGRVPGLNQAQRNQALHVFRKARLEYHALGGRLLRAQDELDDRLAVQRPSPEAVGKAYASVFDVQRQMIELRLRLSNQLRDIQEGSDIVPAPTVQSPDDREPPKPAAEKGADTSGDVGPQSRLGLMHSFPAGGVFGFGNILELEPVLPVVASASPAV